MIPNAECEAARSGTEPRAAVDPRLIHALRAPAAARPLQHPPERRRRGPLRIGLAAGVLAGAGYWFQGPARALGPSSPEAAVFAALARPPAAAADPGASAPLRITGHIVARELSNVGSTVAGRVVELLVREGEAVGAGDPVVRLDATLAMRAVEMADARLRRLAATRDELALREQVAARELERTRRLAQLGVQSNQAREGKELALAAVRSERRRVVAESREVEASLAQERHRLSEFTLRAPFDGIIASLDTHVGEVVGPASGQGATAQALFSIYAPGSLRVEVDVSEQLYERARHSGCVWLEAPLGSEGGRVSAHIERIAPTADRSRATLRVLLEPIAPVAGLIPETSLEVLFEAAHAPGARTAGVCG